MCVYVPRKVVTLLVAVLVTTAKTNLKNIRPHPKVLLITTTPEKGGTWLGSPRQSLPPPPNLLRNEHRKIYRKPPHPSLTTLKPRNELMEKGLKSKKEKIPPPPSTSLPPKGRRHQGSGSAHHSNNALSSRLRKTSTIPLTATPTSASSAAQRARNFTRV